MGYPKRRLVLFFVTQAIAVAAMISLSAASRHVRCGHEGCVEPSAVSMVLAILLILGELAIVAALLRDDRPIWRSLVGIGTVFLVVAVVVVCSIGTCQPQYISPTLGVWHLVVGLLYFGLGSAAGVLDLLAKLRRPDTTIAEDQVLSRMWPFE